MQESKLQLGMDLDGVIYDWDAAVRSIIKSVYKIDLPTSTHWDFVQESISEEQWKFLWSDASVDLGMFSGEAYAGALGALTELCSFCDVSIITKRPENARVVTLKWLAALDLPLKQIIMLNKGENKGDYLASFNVVLDDSEDNWLDYVNDASNDEDHEGGSEDGIFLWDQPWNRSLKTDNRVTSWKDFLSLVRQANRELKGIGE
jgi:hypothetical protein